MSVVACLGAQQRAVRWGALARYARSARVSRSVG
jgi:hypothetical protein